MEQASSDNEGLLKTNEVAAMLNVTRRAVEKWLAGGLLRGYRLGRSYRVKPQDVETFMESRCNHAAK